MERLDASVNLGIVLHALDVGGRLLDTGRHIRSFFDAGHHIGHLFDAKDNIASLLSGSSRDDGKEKGSEEDGLGHDEVNSR